MGYWGGVDGKALPDYDVRECRPLIQPGDSADEPPIEHQLVGPHRSASCRRTRSPSSTTITTAALKQQGVDGVKVDSQSAIEGVAAGLGGRVALTRAYRKGAGKLGQQVLQRPPHQLHGQRDGDVLLLAAIHGHADLD